MIKGGPRIINDGLVLCLDAHDAKSYAGEPVTNLYGDMSTSTALRPNRTEYNTGGTWPSDMPMCPEPVGRVYKHTSGALTSSWSGNSYGYTLKDIATTSGETYICTCWVFVSADCDIDYMYLGIEGYSSGAGIPSGYTQVYNLNNKGTWQQLALYVIADTNVRFLPVYPRHSGVTDGSFSGFYAWGGAQVVEAKNYITPFVLSSRSATNGWVDRSGNGNSGTLTNMIGTETDHYRDGQVIMPVANSYLDFDGTNDYLSIPQFDFTSTHSLEWWFNTDNLTEKYSGGYAGHMLCWGHSPSERIQLRTNGGIRIYIHDGSSGTNFDTSNFSVTAGEWIHITATLDWISKSVKFYQNGVLKDTIDISSMGSWNYTGASNPYDYIDFGRNVNNNNIFYDGKLASIKIYNKVLTAAEVLSNYNATKGRFS